MLLKPTRTTVRGGRLESAGRIPRAAAMLAGIAALALAGTVVVGAPPVRSQPVELVQVDVAVVGKGFRVSKMIGASVVNDKNQKIGSVDDMVMDRDHLMFAILQVGGFLGLGGHLVAVPYASLVVSDDGRKIELPGATKEALLKLAEFKYGV
jgi:sporulation protein YlmC with PRC-barrel domain